MTSTKHTPGPWIGGHYIQGANGSGVCRIVSNAQWTSKQDQTKYGGKTPVIEADANARLIAAAPDLLEALQSILRECALVHKHWGENSNQKQASEAEQRARAAIARATGEHLTAEQQNNTKTKGIK